MSHVRAAASRRPLTLRWPLKLSRPPLLPDPKPRHTSPENPTERKVASCRPRPQSCRPLSCPICRTNATPTCHRRPPQHPRRARPRHCPRRHWPGTCPPPTSDRSLPGGPTRTRRSRSLKSVCSGSSRHFRRSLEARGLTSTRLLPWARPIPSLPRRMPSFIPDAATPDPLPTLANPDPLIARLQNFPLAPSSATSSRLSFLSSPKPKERYLHGLAMYTPKTANRSRHVNVLLHGYGAALGFFAFGNLQAFGEESARTGRRACESCPCHIFILF